jgi:galacturonosyltransferase
MKLFCSLPTHTRAQMGLRGRRHMEEVFDKKKVVEKTVKELEG